MRKFFIALFLGVTVFGISQTNGNKVVTKTDSLSYEIKEITVSSIRANSKSAVSYTDIKADQIEEKNLGQDIPYLISQTPSVIVTSDAGTGIGYTGFRVRGTDANRINMTINGIPFNDPESHGIFFVDIPDIASSLSTVQIQRGVGTSTNGAATFGASINMQTEGLNAVPYAEISSTYGSYNTNKNMVKVGTGLIDNHFAIDARLSNVTSDGYIKRAWVDMKSYYLSAAYYAEKTSLKLITFSGNEHSYQAWNGVNPDLFASGRNYNELGEYTDADGNIQYYDNQTDNYEQTHYQLHLTHEFNSDLYLNASAFYVKGKGYYEEYKPADSWGNPSFELYGLNPVSGMTSTDLVRRKWLDNDFFGGVFALNYKTEVLKASVGGGLNRYIGDHYGNVIWARYAKDLDVTNEFYRSRSYKDDANLYAKASYDLNEELTFTADLQYRFIDHNMKGQNDIFDDAAGAMLPLNIDRKFNFFNPKFGAFYKLAENQSVFASYSIANREPNRSDITNAGLSEQPLSERLYDTELGYNYQNKNFALGLNAYYMKYDNQLVLTGKISEIGEYLTSNVKNSYRAGIELSAGVKILDNLKWDGNVSFSQNKIMNYIQQGIDVYDADWNWLSSVSDSLGTTDIAYSPNVIANSTFTYSLGNFQAALNTSYVGRQYLDNTSNMIRSIDPYLVNNLFLKYSVPCKRIKGIDLKLQVNNLFNEVYETSGYVWYACIVGENANNELRMYPQAPTNFMGSVTLKF